MRFKHVLARAVKFDSDSGAGGTSAGNTDGTGNQQKTAEPQKNVLDGFDLDESIKSALTKDENLSKFALSLLDSKKHANAEAKKYRQELEKLQQKEAEASKKLLEEQGKFKELYEKSESSRTELLDRIKKQSIDFQLTEIANAEGIKKKEYIKLFDHSSLKISDEGVIEGLGDAFSEFKKANADLFKSSEPSVNPYSPKPVNKTGGDMSSIDIARKEPTMRNIAAAIPDLLKVKK